VRLLWSQTTSASLCGLSLARERGWVLAWDAQHWLYLFNQAGQRQAQRPAPTALSAACCADDGSCYAATGVDGPVWLLAPDLTPRWERSVSRPVALALDPFGQYLAVAAGDGTLHVFDRTGRSRWQTANPRPLRHLAFVPERPVLVGSADFGLVACFDATGRCLWRDGLVAHVGSLATTGDGSMVALACFTEGLCCYALEPRRQWLVPQAAPCRLAAVSYSGDQLLTAGLDPRLFLRERAGAVRGEFTLDRSPVALALGALGEIAFAALPDGKIVALETQGR
jgi:hypothetical protein